MGAEDENLNEKILEILSKLEIQFEEGNGLQLLTVLLDSENVSSKELSGFSQKHSFEGVFLMGDKTELQNWLGRGIKIPSSRQEDGDMTFKYLLREDSSGNLADYPYLVLVDTSKTIRNYYRVDIESEVKRMVEHIAMIMPRTPERDIILKREKEK